MVGSNAAHTSTVRARRTGTADARGPVGDNDQADAAERPANPVDHYSLLLQLIQVFPIISGVVLVLVTVTWLAHALAAAGLLVGTIYVIWHERTRGKAAARRADADRARPREVVIAHQGEVRPESRAAAAVVDALLNGQTAGEYAGEYRGVSISIRINGPESSVFRQRYRRRRLRESRARPALPRGEPGRPALFRHEIGSQPEMTLRVVDD